MCGWVDTLHATVHQVISYRTVTDNNKVNYVLSFEWLNNGLENTVSKLHIHVPGLVGKL